MLPMLERVVDEPDDRWVAAVTKVVQGEVVQYVGDIVGRRAADARGGRRLRAVGDRFAYTITLIEAAEVAEMFGEYDRAVGLLERASSSPTKSVSRATRWRCGPGSGTSRSSAATSTPPKRITDRVGRPGRGVGALAAGDGADGSARRSPAAAISSSSPRVSARGWAMPRSKIAAAHADARARRPRLSRRPGRRRRPGARFATEALRRGDRTRRAAQCRLRARGMRRRSGTLGRAGTIALGGRTARRRRSAAPRDGGPMPAGERYDVDRAESAAVGDRRRRVAHGVRGRRRCRRERPGHGGRRARGRGGTDSCRQPSQRKVSGEAPGQRPLCSISSWPPTGGGRNRRSTDHVKDPVPLGTGRRRATPGE